MQAHEYPVPMGMQRYIFENCVFDLPFKYQPIKMVGAGTYGIVISCNNLQTKTHCAIKRLFAIDTVVIQNFYQVLFYFLGRRKKSVARSDHNEKHEP